MCMAVTLMLCLGSLKAQFERVEGTPKEKPLTASVAVPKTVAPIIKGTIFDDIEGHPAFTINSPGHVPWSYHNGNPKGTWGIEGTTFDNSHQPMAFIVFKPSATNPSTATSYPPKSGDQFLACFNVTTGNGLTDGWIISPTFTVDNNATISFWARSLTLQYGNERFKVSTSSTGNAAADFTNVISPGAYVEVATTTWTQYTYNIPNNAKYVAITCVSNDVFALFIDDITISGINYNEADLCDVVSNLAAEVQGTDARLTWNAAPGNPTGYEIFSGNTMLGTTTNTQFVVSNLPSGMHTLGVEATYSEFCLPSRVTTTVNIRTPLNPVRDLEGNCTDGTVTLNWTAPEPSFPGFNDWITYTASDWRGGVGIDGPTDVIWAQRWSPADLAALGITTGSKVQKIKFVFSSWDAYPIHQSTTYEVKVYQGASSTVAGTEKISQAVPFASLVAGEWHEATLNNPVDIDTSLELWIAVRTNKTQGTGRVIATDYGPLVPSVNMARWNGAWMTAEELVNPPFDSNWMIEALITGDAGSAIELSHYNIYRDHVKQEETTNTTFTQTGMEDDSDYCVVAVYETGAQSQKNCKMIFCTPCEAPTNLIVTYAPTCNSATLKWDAPVKKLGVRKQIETVEYPTSTSDAVLASLFTRAEKPAPFKGVVDTRATWLKWCGQNYSAMGYTGDNNKFHVAARFTPEDLAAANVQSGEFISKVAIVAGAEDYETTYTLRIYQGSTTPSNAGTLVYEQPVIASFEQYDDIIVTLTTPYAIDATKELWITYYAEAVPGSHPAACDNGPAVIRKGDLISSNGTSWSSISYGTEWDLNWNIETYVVPAFYNVYLDGELKASNVLGTTYTATDFAPNVDLTWDVTAVCMGGNESAPVTVTSKCPLSISNVVNTGFSMIPNPTTGNVKISAENNFHTIEVVSFLGQTVLSQSNAGNEAILDISALTNGVYFVRVISDNGVNVKKLVKQ